jgi:4-diphosphocytidyl-2-C-methyl-D-erythritol kinase
MALQLGSDVPYFLRKGSALAKGRGEILDYFDLDVPYTILVCYPNIHIPTKWAYEQVQLVRDAKRIDLKALVLDGMKTPLHLVNSLRNDFEPAVFRQYPDVMRVTEAMMRGGAEFASLSGSGSCVFGFFSRTDYADEAGRLLKAKGYRASWTKPGFKP